MVAMLSQPSPTECDVTRSESRLTGEDPQTHVPTDDSRNPDQNRERQNQFGLVRLSLALLVLISHCFPLTQGDNQFEPLFAITGRITLGSLAVNGFFVISGYLITRSWFRCASVREFLTKRMLRIYPAYWLAFAASLAAGFIGAGHERMQYLRHTYARHDAMAQSLFFFDYGTLDDYTAFATNPYPKAVNGSLWSLQAEIQCYCLVVALGLTGVLSRRRAVVALFLICYLMYAAHLLHLGNGELTRWRLWAYFLFGSMMAHRRSSPRDGALALCSAIGLLVSLVQPTLFTLFLPVLGSFVILTLCSLPSHVLGPWFSRMDVSYGVYLYAFPVQQLLVHFHLATTPLQLAMGAVPITLALAWLSWTWVERPALRYGHCPSTVDPTDSSTIQNFHESTTPLVAH